MAVLDIYKWRNCSPHKADFKSHLDMVVLNFSCHLVDNELLQVVQLVVPLVKGHISRRTLAALVKFQDSRYLFRSSSFNESSYFNIF